MLVSGISLNFITDAAIECQRKTDPDNRAKIMEYMINQMSRFLMELKRRKRGCCGAVHGNYLTACYIFVKLLYIINVIGQIFLLNLFLGTSYHLYGYQVVRNLLRGKDWTTSDRFPRVTLCDFKIRVLGHVNRYTVQCALPINLFNEKLYTFIWFWLVIVAAFTIISFFLWAIQMACIPRLKLYVRTKLIAMDKLAHASDNTITDFTRNYLHRDGTLILWLVAENSSDLIAAELLCGIYDKYRTQKHIHLPNNVSAQFDPAHPGHVCAAQSLRKREVKENGNPKPLDILATESAIT